LSSHINRRLHVIINSIFIQNMSDFSECVIVKQYINYCIKDESKIIGYSSSVHLIKVKIDEKLVDVY